MLKGAIGVANWLVGVDTGGTFTDLIAFDQASGALRRAKVPSVPDDPSLAVIDALEKLFAEGAVPADIAMFVHGTTVATNALLEGRGVRAGLLITKGFRAVYEARGWSQPRGSDLLDTFYQKPPLLVPQYLTEEVLERVDYEGNVVTPLDEEMLRTAARKLVRKGAEAIAMCFLFSFVNPAHERGPPKSWRRKRPIAAFPSSSAYCRSFANIRGCPRQSSTPMWGLAIANYLTSLEKRLDAAGVATPQQFLMQSNGGLMRISIGARHPNQTLLSGPAAGVIAGADARAHCRRAATSSPSTWAAPAPTSASSSMAHASKRPRAQIAGQDIGTPMLRVRTLGAGGGTIAAIGKDGLLKVGPQQRRRRARAGVLRRRRHRGDRD